MRIEPCEKFLEVLNFPKFFRVEAHYAPTWKFQWSFWDPRNTLLKMVLLAKVLDRLDEIGKGYCKTFLHLICAFSETVAGDPS
jgi:hypothetical protein